MADDQATAPDVQGVDEAVDAPEVDWRSWANLWQIPAILISIALIGLGVWIGTQRTPENDFVAALDEVDRMIAHGELAPARRRLEQGIEPHLDAASEAERARFHATVADWIGVSQEMREVSLEENNEAIDARYRKAIELGAVLTTPRIERWAKALIDTDQYGRARELLAELEGLAAAGGGGNHARARRNALLQRLVRRQLEHGDRSFEQRVALLREFRDDDLLSTDEKAWAASRLARLRLDAGHAGEAVEHLLVDLRRLEAMSPSLAEQTWGRLHTLLGRGYFQLGEYAHAQYYLNDAIRRFVESEDVCGEALVLLGRIDTARNDPERAYERFDEVVRDYPGTRSFLPAMLGRAEVLSILGRHEESLADYRVLLDELKQGGSRDEIDRWTVADSLADRHDAALALGKLPLAMEYVTLAEAMFQIGEVPDVVLFRIASTSRQIAENILREAVGGDPREAGDELKRLDPALRHRANEHYEKAAKYFLRHARALTARPEADERWAESLWLAADSYDLAGRRVQAIRHFREYVEGRPITDPRRAEVLFRLAQAQQAQMEYEAAAANYERLIDERPRSPWGTQSHVPLARCYLALDRRPEAERQLRSVLDGAYPVGPEAMDYRNALIELGGIYYESGQYKSAIERLQEAVERYPYDERVNETRFRLADSHRRHAMALAERLASEPDLSPGDRMELNDIRNDSLARALELFDLVCTGYASEEAQPLDGLQHDYERYAWLYRADCAYELGRYEQAVEMYDRAARRYSDHVCAVHALVQIINCYDALGDAERAQVAHRNALKRLAQLPEGAFDDPQALMTREAWDRWLRNRPVGTLVQSPMMTPPN